jgi:hypothetical protein
LRNLARLSLSRLNSSTETQACCAYIRKIFGLDWTHFFIFSFYVVDGACLINSGRKLIRVNTQKSPQNIMMKRNIQRKQQREYCVLFCALFSFELRKEKKICPPVACLGFSSYPRTGKYKRKLLLSRKSYSTLFLRGRQASSRLGGWAGEVKKYEKKIEKVKSYIRKKMNVT